MNNKYFFTKNVTMGSRNAAKIDRSPSRDSKVSLLVLPGGRPGSSTSSFGYEKDIAKRMSWWAAMRKKEGGGPDGKK